MRILIVNTIFDRSECNIFAALPGLGFETELICNEQAPYQEELLEAGVKITHMDVKHRLDLRSVAVVRRHLKQDGVNVIYAPRNGTLSVSLMASVGLNVSVAGYRGTMGHLSHWDPASWLTYLNPRLARIVCVSNAVRTYLLSFGLPESRIITIYKGHDPNWYETETPSLEEFGIPPGSFVVGFTGNMRPVKGIDVLLKAASRLPDDTNVRLLLVGEVRDRKLLELAKRPDIKTLVHFTGFRKDATDLVSACDAYIMPSIEREGLPRGVIEAMCQEKPPIVTAVGGMPELVEDGKSGIVVPPLDPDALAKAIISLSTDIQLCKTLGKAARTRIENHFNIAGTITEMSNLFREMAGE
ncbi:MAG: glycosyltransferase family 4 protein [Kiritimatiellia bacterium]|nr:glycosyltransferase family 4 protein [Kiritimatiellia bacterium]MDP6848829.1 glycosyltransferase family 4 protein [Kiritimatiellia bacterium]